MTSFLKYLNSLDPDGNECAVCGGKRYACACEETPSIDDPLTVTMFHPVSHKRLPVERYTDKYIVMRAAGWIELDS